MNGATLLGAVLLAATLWYARQITRRVADSVCDAVDWTDEDVAAALVVIRGTLDPLPDDIRDSIRDYVMGEIRAGRA